MNIEVEMLAFDNGRIRVVDIPDAEWNKCANDRERLEQVFYYGQNDFQPKPYPSVSVGDVVRLADKRFRCESVGWKDITTAEATA